MSRSEHGIQSRLVAETNYLLRPEIVRLAIPNGGARHPLVGKMLKEEGLIPGSPDLIYVLPRGRVFWQEMKRDSGRLSDEQIGMHYRFEQLGHDVGTAYSVDEALEQLSKRGLLKSNW